MMETSDGIISSIDLLLQILCFSAIATDWKQSEQWAFHPVVGDGAILIEFNQAIADDPERLEDLIQFNMAATYMVPRMLDPPWSTLVLGGIAFVQVANVIGNNINSQVVGLPQKWALAYTAEF